MSRLWGVDSLSSMRLKSRSAGAEVVQSGISVEFDVVRWWAMGRRRIRIERDGIIVHNSIDQ